MTPAALLAAGLLAPAPTAVEPPVAAYAPAAPAEVIEANPSPAPWWRSALQDFGEPSFGEDRTGAFAVPLPPSLAIDGGDDFAVRLLEPAPGGGPAAWVTQTSLLGRALRSRGRLRADYWTDFDDTTRVGAGAVATTWVKNLALDGEANYWQQTRDPFPGDRLGGTWWTGDLNAVFRVADHPRGRLRTGGGAAWIVQDDGDADVGYNATVACDFGLLSHAVAGFEVDYGKIGGDDLFRWRVGGGWAFKWCHLRVGYDDYRLGGEDREGAFAGVVVRY